MLYLSGGALRGADQHEAVRAYLGALYQKVWGEPIPPVEKRPTGQPYFPVEGRFCALTHTKLGAFCALSDHPVGLDAEQEDRAVSLSLAEKILAPEELVQFQAAPDPRLCLLTFWVLKEAYVKYTGQGLRGQMKAFPFDLSGSRPYLRLPEGERLYFTLLHRHGHLLALCSPDRDPPQFL